MTRAVTTVGVFAVLSVTAYAQAPTPPAFDIADVHVSPHVTNPYMRGGALRGGRYDVRTASMLDLISAAYSVDAAKVQGGPSWLDTDRFDIAAKAPVNTPPESVKQMLQTLLAERFALKVHMDTKPMPVFVLSVGKGKPKLKEWDGSSPSGCRGEPQTPAPGAVPYIVVACHNQTMEQLAQGLRDMAGGYVTNPVVDQTGLKGAWDFEIKWTGRGQLALAGADGISIFDAVDKQLGLKLEPQRIATPVIVVDSVNQRPTDNPPGVSAALPPRPPAEFEVATIRPSRPDATNSRARLEHGRVDAENMPLKNIIMFAWDLNADELLAGAPKFLDSAHFDITAQAPAGMALNEVDDEVLRLMVRALLADRFHLKAHMEERPVDGYVLSGNKPKMQKADPSNRTGCKEGPGPDGKDPRIANPVLNRLVNCQNMTMAQFAAQLPNMANGYAHVDVLDATGLTDAYDFTLSFSGINLFRNGGIPGRPPAAADGNSPSDPNGAVSLPDAIGKQLGLKLDLKKRPMQVLVIDHIDEKPTDN
ncbi:MAG: TIGR03435 family protein [Bryobacterales bacterium]|nr:TIGR03435 family protein [Bryobacterales bacterium]MBV9397057.1 TIGR03435 family protein [Bryobacterales bacterium]